jgi:CDGSH-type Zn-finger protein/uncharacterized Fe-S cluster protein YjdI
MTDANGRRHYTDDGLLVTWDAQRCIHAAACIAAQPEVFDADRRPWVDVGRAAHVDVAAAVRGCPTGALRYAVTPSTPQKAEDVPPEQPAPTGRIEVRTDGPYYVRGDITLRDAEGAVISTDDPRMALCRCGFTGNAPYCDNSHEKVGFANEPSAYESTDGTAGAALTIQPDEPGPFHVSGGVCVVRQDGEVLAETDEVWLCRCGKSGTKPFCDGSHAG